MSAPLVSLGERGKFDILYEVILVVFMSYKRFLILTLFCRNESLGREGIIEQRYIQNP